jgi:hypothetical protein
VKKIILLFFCTCALASLGQTAKEKKHLLFYTVGYRIPVINSKVINSGHGIYLEGGLNAGKFLRENTIVGLYGGWAFRDLLWSTSFSNNFAHDYKTSIITPEHRSTNSDSSLIALSSDLIHQAKGRSFPDCGTKSFHNYSLYAGLVIKLPYDWFPLTKIYTGTTRSHYYDSAPEDGDHTILQLRRKMYGAEVVVINNFCRKSDKNKIQLSVYGEIYNFTNSQIFFDNGQTRRTLELKQYTSIGFRQKYNNDYAAGIKLALTIL